MHGEDEMLSWSVKPAGQRWELQGPNSPAVFRSLPAGHATHMVLGSESWSTEPAAHWNAEHAPERLAGTYTPGAHVTHGVAGFESSSMLPAMQPGQVPLKPEGWYVPAAHGVQGVDARLSKSVEPAAQGTQGPDAPVAV
jgi:hypothetical protein